LTVYPDILRNCKVFDTWNFNKNNDNDIIIEEVISHMDRLMIEKKAAELLLERSNAGTISCSEARAIAEESGLPYSSVGKLADDLRIKIRNCELGCF
jgi:LAO/AO transport system kinase